jgi:hypothetical protein
VTRRVKISSLLGIENANMIQLRGGRSDAKIVKMIS